MHRTDIRAQQRRLEQFCTTHTGSHGTKFDCQIPVIQGDRSTFDATNRPVTATAADGSVVSYVYDAGGALFAQAVVHRGTGSPQPVLSDLFYNARGQRVSAALGNGTVQTSTYDPLTFRLVRLRTRRTSDGVDLQDLRYTYDPEGNPTEIRDFAQQRTFFHNNVVYPSRRYQYDAAYRLLRAEGRETATTPTSPWSAGPTPEQPIRTGSDPAAMRRYVEQFSFDANGNLLTLAHAVPSNTAANWTRTMTYGAGSNRLATYQGTGSAGIQAPVYDEFGQNLEAPALDELDWDAEGRLRRTKNAAAGTQQVRYVYDGGGTRVRKVVETYVASAWVVQKELIYVCGIDIERSYAGGDLEEEILALHLFDGDRRIALVETRTVHEGDAVATPLAKWRFQHDDHLRSACVETNATGTVISYEEFHAFGTTAYSAHTAALEERPKRYRYSGKERDEESGLLYYGARYLAPWMGRWLSPDPAGTVDGVNLFGFCRGNPVRFADADGRSAFDFIESAAANAGLRESAPGQYSARPAPQVSEPAPGGFNRFVSNPLLRGAVALAERVSADLGAVDVHDPVVITRVTDQFSDTQAFTSASNEYEGTTTVTRDLFYSQNGTLVHGSESVSYSERVTSQAYLVGDGTMVHGEQGLQQYRFQRAVDNAPVGTLSAIATIAGREDLVPATNVVGDMVGMRPGGNPGSRGSRRPQTRGQYRPGRNSAGANTQNVEELLVGRSGAFNEAKRDLGIPRAQRAMGIARVRMTNRDGSDVLGTDGRPIYTLEYTYQREDGSRVVIQEHSVGHRFHENGRGDQGPHFNVRPHDDTRSGTVPGTKSHYPFRR